MLEHAQHLGYAAGTKEKSNISQNSFWTLRTSWELKSWIGIFKQLELEGVSWFSGINQEMANAQVQVFNSVF